jgi:hypothetical protein
VARPKLEGLLVESAEFDAVFDAEGMLLADRGDKLLFAERLRFQSIG